MALTPRRWKWSRILIVALLLLSSRAGRTQTPSIPDSKKSDSGYQYRTGSPDGIGKWYLGREIAHVMGASGSNWLDREVRQDEENPALAIDSIKLPPAAAIADIGAGTGYYSFRLARKYPHGRVYAVEIQDEMLTMLKAKKRALKDSVVNIVKGSPSSPNLPDNSIDLAIMVDVYHELGFPREMLQSLRKSLKKSGEILLIEYRGEDPAVPIKPLHKTTVSQLNRELGANGFQLAYQGEFLPIQHFLLYRKR